MAWFIRTTALGRARPQTSESQPNARSLDSGGKLEKQRPTPARDDKGLDGPTAEGQRRTANDRMSVRRLLLHIFTDATRA